MMKHTLLAVLILIPLALNGCSSVPGQYTSTHSTKKVINGPAIKTKLKAQHKEWKGTPYRYGGLSKRGIDCSGFVYLTYRNKLGIDLPRSTELQAKMGTPILQNKLAVGDLVFFKTGFSKRHVGIYIGNQKFLHASTSKGVTISSMDNVYWRSKYWKAQRI